MSKKWIFFFLILACLSLSAGCGKQEEAQPKGELVMAPPTGGMRVVQ